LPLAQIRLADPVGGSGAQILWAGPVAAIAL
jgi:hypothetical protein